MMRRDSTIDIMKGLLILSVVVAHSQIPYLHRFIYLFHMSAFFMVSGYLWNQKYATDVKITELIKKRIVSLYIPYIACNIGFLLIYTVIPIIFDYPFCDNTIIGFCKAVLKILIFRGRCSLSSQTWFVAVLFVVNIGYTIIFKLIYKISNHNRNRIIIMSVLAIISLIFGNMLYLYNINFFQIGTILSSFGVFHIGYLLKYLYKYYDVKQRTHKQNIMIFCMTCGVMIGLLFLTDIEVRLIDNIVVNFIYFSIGALLGWYFVNSMAYMINKTDKIRRMCEFLGQHTMSILCLHFLAFKIVGVFQCLVLKLSFTHLSDFPVIRGNGIWWILYSIAGIIIPLGAEYIWINIKNKKRGYKANVRE